MTAVHGDMKLDTPEEIRDAMKEQGVRQVDLANALGFDNPNKVSLSLAGKRQFKAREMDIIRGMLGAKPEGSADGKPTRKIAIVGSVPGGDWREAVQRALGHLPVPEDTPPNALALEVEGDSMDKEAPPGSHVIFDPDDRALYPGDMYVVINDEGETTFKMFMADPARLVPLSSNPKHRDIVIGDDPFQVVGAVIAVVKNYRRRR